ncbi:MAG: relaxase/mobilization nuclease domain-containing protein [Schaalia hyovaginalis]|uniref:relaxase/mobilization nuclease domain-containing protein n=1 Tax=Schaalia hyovaginalis TaxID=29316 RepID=UPI002A91E570|nr:relaxase/mobilization nuclease domain-containing protein [Schaalia hyovaginalis]MDY6213639.1 relaxase/mobilization nuclease domain-containing protein [Schaalia hyovaginalis]
MIPNIVDGGDTAGLMRYLVGPGRSNEHENAHLVAGDPVIMDRFEGWKSLSLAQAGEIAGMIDRLMRANDVQVTGPIRKFNPESGKTEIVDRGANHVWHCSLSLPPRAGRLDDETWAKIAGDFMDEMGFTEASGKAPCRWVAVRHGVSKNGGDHIHIAANIVRGDGTKWSSWQDWTKAHRACNALEHKYGLEVIESREHNRGSRCDTPTELRQAKREGRPFTTRAMLETRVRAAATSSASEAEFVRSVRGLGVRIRPRFAKGRTDVVVGYSVALHASAEPNSPQRWYSGSSLARDLTLPRLRDRWADTPHDAQAAADEWRAAWQGIPARRRERPYDEREFRASTDALAIHHDVFSTVDPFDPIALADATQDVAGLLSAAALQPGIDQAHARLYSRAARSLGRHAQLKTRAPRLAPTRDPFTHAARLLLTTSHPRSTAARAAAMLDEMTAFARSVANLHRAAAQAQTAAMIERDLAGVFTLVNSPTLDPQLARVYELSQATFSAGPAQTFRRRAATSTRIPSSTASEPAAMQRARNSASQSGHTR